MLSKEDNELICRVGPGTPMGALLRRYWFPIFPSRDLPPQDDRPRRIRLLGEDLVIFRSPNGEIAMMQEKCAHRGASICFGRNEEGGIRCVYHGWKYAPDGRCVDMPNEPPNSTFREKIRMKAYRVVERNGVVWAYMGDMDNPISDTPPELEWSLVPDSQRVLTLRLQRCNWIQAMEGALDSSHAAFLHAHLDDNENLADAQRRQGTKYKLADKHPRYDTVATEAGLLMGARRNAEADSYYWRITQFLMPFHTLIPPYGPSPKMLAHAWVPIDDETTMTWAMTWHPLRDLTPAEVKRLTTPDELWQGTVHLPWGLFQPPSDDQWGAYIPLPSAENHYMIDWDRQRTLRYSGIPTAAMQDAAMQESMGKINDRTAEHLGSSDVAIIRMRRLLLRAVRAFHDSGIEPPGALDPTAYRVRATSQVIPMDADWVAATEEQRQATVDRLFDST